MQDTTITKNQHAMILTLLGIMLVAILLLAGIYLSELWFGVTWVALGLGGWSFSYYTRRKAPGWEIIPAAILGGAAMVYYINQFIRES